MLITGVIFLTSCIKEQYPKRYGFDSKINKSSKGTVVARVSSSAEDVFLNGWVNLSRGDLEIILENGQGEEIFYKELSGRGEFGISEKFRATRGYWTLKYISYDAEGDINLHLKY